MDKSQNSSAIYSRTVIVQALLRLMQHKKYTDITITMLANEAQIGRKTFYRHFYSLEDVLDEYVEELLAEYRALLTTHPIHNIYEHIPVYFHFWSMHMDFLQILQRNNLLVFIFNKYENVLSEIFTLLPCALDPTDATYDYFLSYTASSFWGLLYKWVLRGGLESPEEMAQIFINFFTQVANTTQKKLTQMSV